MSWPTAQDYNEAIQNSATSMSDPSLKSGEVMVNALGLPVPFSGNFADVYQFKGGDGKMWAIKCFTRQVQGLQERYTQIGQYLGEAKLPFTVGFEYQAEGIRIRGKWFPILKMEWVEGMPVNIFVKENIGKNQYLHGLGEMWGKLCAKLRDADMAHADLQHGNVLLVPGSSPSKLGLKLIDYDGMWVPPLAKSPSGEVGHPNYQHPLRKKEQLYNADVDRVPHLVIAAALRATLVGGKAIWDKFDNGDNLLFREADLREPAKAPVFKALWDLGDPVLRTLVGHLALSVGQPLRKTPWLDDILFDKAGPKLTADQEKEVCALLGIEDPSKATKSKAAAPAVAKEFNVFANIDVDDAEPKTISKSRRSSLNFQDEEEPSHKNDKRDDEEVDFKVSTRRRPGGERYIKNAPKSNMGIFVGVGLGVLAIVGVAIALSMKGKKPAGTTTPEVVKEDSTDNTGGGDPHEKKDPKVQPDPKKVGPLDKGHPLGKDPKKFPVVLEAEKGLRPGVVGYSTPSAVLDAVTLPGTKFYLAIADKDPSIYVGYSVGNNAPQTLKLHTKPVTALAASGDGSKVIAGDSAGGLHIWPTELKKDPIRVSLGQVENLKKHSAPILACALSKDGDKAVSLDRDGLICWWDAADKELVNSFTLEGALTFAFLPDEKTILTGNEKAGAGIWDLKTGKPVRMLNGYSGSLRCLSVSGDGKTGYTAGEVNQIRMWNLENGEQLKKFERSEPGFRALAATPDNRLLASFGEDEHLVVWDVQKGKQLNEWPEENPIVSLSFYPEGDRLLCGVSKLPSSGSVRIVRTGDSRDIPPKSGDVEKLLAGGKFVPLSLDKVANVDSTKGMFVSEVAEQDKLILPDWKPRIVEGIPFVLIDPVKDEKPNLIILNSPIGAVSRKYPEKVTLPVGAAAKAIHLLSGVGGFAFPFTKGSEKGSLTMTARLVYRDGKTEDHEYKNGEHFADWFTRVEVPGSTFAFSVGLRQVRYIAIHPKRTEAVKEIEFIKAPNENTAPMIFAATVETLGGKSKDTEVAKDAPERKSHDISSPGVRAFFSGDETKIYVASSKGVLHILDAKTLESPSNFVFSTGSPPYVWADFRPKHTFAGATVPERVYLLTAAKHLVVWESDPAKVVKDIALENIITDKLTGYHFAASPDGKGVILYLPRGTGKAHYVDISDTGKVATMPKALQSRGGQWKHVIFSADGKAGAAYSGSDGVVWSTTTNEILHEFKAAGPIAALALIPESTTVVVFAQNIRQAWNYTKKTDLWKVAETSEFAAIETSGIPKSDHFIALNQETYRIFDARDGKVAATWKSDGRGSTVSLSGDGRYAAVLTPGKPRIDVWTLPSFGKSTPKTDPPKDEPRLVVRILVATPWVSDEMVYEFKKEGTFSVVGTKRHGKFVIALDQKEITLKWEGEKREDEKIMVDPVSDQWMLGGKPFVPKK
jgi:WD40 repeat protein